MIKTQRIASMVIITALVTGMVSGIFMMVKSFVINWLKTNGGH